MKRLNDTIQVLTKESARLNPLSSNVKSGSDGLLLVSDQPNKYTTGASAREQQNPIHSDSAKSTDSTEAEVNLTFVELAGIAIAEGANKNSNILSRWPQGMTVTVQQNSLPSGVQAAITLPSETTHYLHHIPSFPLQITDDKENYATAQWDGSNHATVNISQLMRKNINKQVNIILLVSLLHEKAIVPFGVAILDMSSLSTSDNFTEEKIVHVQGVALPNCKLTRNKSLHTIHRQLTASENCTLRIRVEKLQNQYHKQQLISQPHKTSSNVEKEPSPHKTIIVLVPQSEEKIRENSWLDRLSIVEERSVKGHSKECHDIMNSSSFEVCIADDHPTHRNISTVTHLQQNTNVAKNCNLGRESESKDLDTFEEENFGFTRLLQSIESIGFQLFDSVRMLKAPTVAPCSAPLTTHDDLEVALSSEGLGLDGVDENSDFNVNGRIRINNRNTSAGNYSVEDQLDPCDLAKHFQGGSGTLIADRYIINRDLGVGTFGRVVACVDMHQQHQKEFDQKVAIKIVRNDIHDIEAALLEADILRHVNSHNDRRGTSLCVTMLNQFYFLDRRHYCLVFESLGLSLYDFMKNHDFQPFPLYCVQDFSYQLLDVLEFLHSIKFIVPESTRIKLIDFGGATFDDDYKSSVINTREYRAPEILLKLSTRWSFPSDMWSLGCILAELYTGECLFLASDKYEHFALIDGVVGPFPKHMIEDSPVAKPFFDSNGRFRRQALPSISSQTMVEQVQPLEGMNVNVNNNSSNDDQAFRLLQLLMKLLVIDPCLRATASEAFQLPFPKGCNLNY